jgi:hypothetical protein
MNSEKTIELIAAHGLEGYGLYMYLSNMSTDNVFHDEWLSEVVGIGRLRISEVIVTCIELGLLELKSTSRV